MGMFKKNKNTRYEGAVLNDVNVVIVRLMNNTPVEVAEFTSSQVRDTNNNLFLVNADKSFKEDLERKRHYIIDHLYYKLELSDMSKELKLKKIDDKIKSLEDKIKTLESNNEGTENITDFKNDLKHFKILRYTVANAGEGSFEIINKQGQREMRFLARDGVFDPYFYRSDKDKGSPLTMTPDIALSRKYHKEIDDRIENRLLRNQNPDIFSGIKGILVIVAVVVMIGANILWATRNMEEMNNIDDRIAEYREKAVGSAIDCAFYYTKLIEDGLINKSIDYSINIKPEKKNTGSMVDLSKKVTGQ